MRRRLQFKAIFTLERQFFKKRAPCLLCFDSRSNSAGLIKFLQNSKARFIRISGRYNCYVNWTRTKVQWTRYLTGMKYGLKSTSLVYIRFFEKLYEIDRRYWKDGRLNLFEASLYATVFNHDDEFLGNFSGRNYCSSGTNGSRNLISLFD